MICDEGFQKQDNHGFSNHSFLSFTENLRGNDSQTTKLLTIHTSLRPKRVASCWHLFLLLTVPKNSINPGLYNKFFPISTKTQREQCIFFAVGLRPPLKSVTTPALSLSNNAKLFCEETIKLFQRGSTHTEGVLCHGFQSTVRVWTPASDAAFSSAVGPCVTHRFPSHLHPSGGFAGERKEVRRVGMWGGNKAIKRWKCYSPAKPPLGTHLKILLLSILRLKVCCLTLQELLIPKTVMC